MADLRKPVFFSTEASILGCTKLADYLFQYDEVEVAPTEIVNGLGAMPPEYSFGKYQIWSNSFTLGITSQIDARPVFYAADMNDLNDILVGVNTVAARLGSPLQTDPNDGRTWLEGISEVYVHALGSDPTVCDPSVTNTYSGGAGPGGLFSSLLRIDHTAHRFSGPALAEFDTQQHIATKACVLEKLQAAYDAGSGITQVGWNDITTEPHPYHAWTTNLGWDANPVVGDVIYRDNTGSTYFGEGGFLFQDTAYVNTMSLNGSSFIWVTVGANGVVTDVESLSYMVAGDPTSGSTTGIIASGLIAELDALYANSYSGTGSVWTDLTGNGHNATISGPTYSSDNNGIFEVSTNGSTISFSGANSISEFSVNNNISANGGFTAQVWVYRPNLPSWNIINKTGEYGIRTLRNNYTIGTNISAGPYSTPVLHSQWQLITLQGFSIDAGADGYVSPTHPWAGQQSIALRSYFNNIKNLNANDSAYDYYIDGQFAPGNSTTNPLQLFVPGNYSSAMTGKIGAFYFYDRILTDQEVADNYNNTKSRFGL